VADDWDPEAVAKIEAARRAAVPQGQVADRMEWRNRALMRLMALKEGLKTP
jgi:L-gulonate 3-dehydrogenase